MKKAVLFLICLTLFAVQGFSTEIATIKYLTASGSNDPDHQSVFQIDFGGDVLGVPGCNRQFAAIRKDGLNDHLIILAMTAASTNKQVLIELNPNDIYFSAESGSPYYTGDPSSDVYLGSTYAPRCTISRLSIAY